MLEDDGLRTSLVVSSCLHVGALLVLYFGLPVLFKPLPAPPTRFVPFDIVDIGAITNTRLPGTVEGDIKGGPPAAAKEQPKEQEKPAESRMLPPPSKPDIPPPPPETGKGAEKADAEIDETAMPKPQQKPKPPEPPKAPPKQQPDLTSILKNVAKLKPTTPHDPDAKQGKKEIPKSQDLRTDILDSAANAASKEGGASKEDGTSGGGYGPSLSDRLTISQEDALRRQIGQCWNIPAGARNAQDLVVEVLIEVNPDRTVKDAKIVDQFRASTDSFFRAAAESALRALRSPKCSPLELPPDQYEQWKTIRFNFDPRDIL